MHRTKNGGLHHRHLGRIDMLLAFIDQYIPLAHTSEKLTLVFFNITRR
jgi:hypothetical protein